jgi:hypothetical protein
VAFAPDAQVLHAFAASARRAADRCPLSLFEVGRSLALFLRRHGDSSSIPKVTAHFRDQERRRLLRHMVTGGCGPEEVGALLATFDAGLADGQRARDERRASWEDAVGLLQFPGLRSGAGVHVLATRPSRRRKARAEAARLAGEGNIVTLMTFSRTTLYHRAGFHPDGYWFQSGGLFGRSERTQPLFRHAALGERAEVEWARMSLHRTPAVATIRTQIR